jgi:hypothetical protein
MAGGEVNGETKGGSLSDAGLQAELNNKPINTNWHILRAISTSVATV